MIRNKSILSLYFSIATYFMMSSNLTFGSERPRWEISKASISRVLGDRSLVSTSGRELILYSMTKISNSRKPMPRHRFLIQGGLHGNEEKTSILVKWLLKRTVSEKGILSSLPEGTTIDFLPFANPDNYGKSRYNTNQINLNRNFPVLWGVSQEPNGHKPSSEKETQAITALLRSRNYTATVDIHGYINWIVGPSKPSYFQNISKNRKDTYYRWMSVLKKEMSILPGYEIKDAGSLGDGGAFEDTAFWSFGSLSFCLEMKSPLRFNHKGTDQFALYERFIFGMFRKAMSFPRKQRIHEAYPIAHDRNYNKVSKPSF